MASRGRKGETVTDYIFLGSRITADGACTRKIKRCFLLERKTMTNLDSILKSRDISSSEEVVSVSSGQFKLQPRWLKLFAMTIWERRFVLQAILMTPLGTLKSWSQPKLAPIGTRLVWRSGTRFLRTRFLWGTMKSMMDEPWRFITSRADFLLPPLPSPPTLISMLVFRNSC